MLKRESQFGGTSSSNPYSYLGLGGGGERGGAGVNSYFPDRDFDMILQVARQLTNELDERNVEERLMEQHKYVEDDIVAKMSFEDRIKYKQMRQLRLRKLQRQRDMESIETNSPAYIRSHFAPKPSDKETIETKLQARRLIDPAFKSPLEDGLPDRIMPTRRHTVSFTHGRGIPGQRGEDQEDTREDSNYEKQRMHFVPLGNTPLLLQGSDFQEYMGDAAKQNARHPSGFNEPLLWDAHAQIQDAPRFPDHSHAEPITSPEFDALLSNPYLPLEKRLKSKRRPSYESPKDPYQNWDAHEGAGGFNSVMGLADAFPQNYDHVGTMV